MFKSFRRSTSSDLVILCCWVKNKSIKIQSSCNRISHSICPILSWQVCWSSSSKLQLTPRGRWQQVGPALQPTIQPQHPDTPDPPRDHSSHGFGFTGAFFMCSDQNFRDWNSSWEEPRLWTMWIWFTETLSASSQWTEGFYLPPGSWRADRNVNCMSSYRRSQLSGEESGRSTGIWISLNADDRLDLDMVDLTWPDFLLLLHSGDQHCGHETAADLDLDSDGDAGPAGLHNRWIHISDRYIKTTLSFYWEHCQICELLGLCVGCGHECVNNTVDIKSCLDKEGSWSCCNNKLVLIWFNFKPTSTCKL